MRVLFISVRKPVHFFSFTSAAPDAHRKSARFVSLFITSLLLVSACRTSSLTPAPLVVEGTITVRGNEPFSAVILQTSDRNHYILKMSTAMRKRLITPAYRRVTGRLYLEQWNGRDFAHLEVYQIETVSPDTTEAASSSW